MGVVIGKSNFLGWPATRCCRVWESIANIAKLRYEIVMDFLDEGMTISDWSFWEKTKKMGAQFWSAASSFFRFPVSENNANLAKLLWLVKLRWVAIALFFALAFPGINYNFLSRDSIAPYLGVIAIFLVFNLLSQLYWTEKNRSVGLLVLFFHLTFDLVGLTFLLAMSRGFENPFAALILLNASLAGITSDANRVIVSFGGIPIWKYDINSLTGNSIPDPMKRIWTFPVKGNPTGAPVMDDEYYYTCFAKEPAPGTNGGVYTRAPMALNRHAIFLD